MLALVGNTITPVNCFFAHGSIDHLVKTLVTLVMSSPGPADRIQILKFPIHLLPHQQAKAALIAAKALIQEGKPLNTKTVTERAGLEVLLAFPVGEEVLSARLECVRCRLEQEYNGPPVPEEPWQARLDLEECSLPE